jgi:hypothetical protein
MTEYIDVPKANALHMESQQVAQAIANLEAGGTLTSMFISPPPPAPVVPGEPGEPVALAPLLMPVSVMVPPPLDPALLANITAWLNQRMTDIAAELSALGVTVPPQGDALWTQTLGPPPFGPAPQIRGAAA